MKKLIFIFVCLFCTYEYTQGQQIHQLTQYSLNDFVFNPAVAGSVNERIVARATYRRQWVGIFDGAEPTTMIISGHSNVYSNNMGMGLMVYNDKTGPNRSLGVQLSYAYHIPLNNKENNPTKLSLGISGLLLQRSIDQGELNAYDASDPSVFADNSQINGDANFGAYLYNNDYFFGVSALQLIQSKYQLTETNTTSITDAMHIYVTGGYKLRVNEDIDLQPTAILKYVENDALGFEVNARGIYRDMYWAGLGYRNSDAISLLLGIDLENGLSVGYSYDLITSELNSVSRAGSHELSIGYSFESDMLVKKVRSFDANKKLPKDL